MIHIYLLFIQWKLPAFAKFNKFLQTEEPLIHCLHDELQKFRNNLAAKFINSEFIQKLKEETKNKKKRELKRRNSHKVW